MAKNFSTAMGADRENIPWQGIDLAARVGRAQGKCLDREHLLHAEAITVNLAVYCPDDALDDVGRMLKIERYFGEPDATYRERLKAGWDTWELAGLPEAIVRSLNAYGIIDVTIYRWDEWPTPDDWFSKFYVVLGPSMPYEAQIWGTFSWGDPSTWGSTATVNDVRAIWKQIIKWKAPHGVPVAIILNFGDGFVWGVDVWGNNVWGGTAVVWPLFNGWGESWVFWGGFNWGNGKWNNGEL